MEVEEIGNAMDYIKNNEYNQNNSYQQNNDKNENADGVITKMKNYYPSNNCEIS